MQVFTVCARTAFTPSVLRNVVLPDMFEPVTRTPLLASSAIELLTPCSSNGWDSLSRVAGLLRGRKTGRVQSLRLARYDATLIAASTSPIAATTRSSAGCLL